MASMMQLRSLQSRCRFVCVGVVRKVDEVVRVHVGYLATALSGHNDASAQVVPCGSSSLIRLRAGSVELGLGNRSDDFVALAAPRVCRGGVP